VEGGGVNVNTQLEQLSLNDVLDAIAALVQRMEVIAPDACAANERWGELEAAMDVLRKVAELGSLVGDDMEETKREVLKVAGLLAVCLHKQEAEK